ncbi:MAG: nucleotide exchange factor GrpE [Acidimicrobiales bacterium]
MRGPDYGGAPNPGAPSVGGGEDPIESQAEPKPAPESGPIPGPDSVPGWDDPAMGPDEISAAEVDPVARERDEYLDALRRLQAEFENFKKRASRQQVEYVTRATEGLVTKLLPVLDTMDLALAHVDDPSSVDQVATALGDVLTKEGLERIDPVIDAEFDPNEHDAVMHEDGDGPPQVCEVLRAGYRFGGKVLRPAMVKVRG